MNDVYHKVYTQSQYQSWGLMAASIGVAMPVWRRIGDVSLAASEPIRENWEPSTKQALTDRIEA